MSTVEELAGLTKGHFQTELNKNKEPKKPKPAAARRLSRQWPVSTPCLAYVPRVA
tara:strand:- start:1142 stop:1306 length:165 start_codon:yes stop_codon:yes gene_type:complete